MKFIAIIPARYASTRFPGKPLVSIQGKPMVQHVYEKVTQSGLFEKVIVATDDNRIQRAVEEFGGEVVITDSNHKTGTDRCGEVIEVLKDSFDVVINIQGDEPFIHQSQLEELTDLFESTPAQIGTLKKELSNPEDIFNPNIVKVVAGLDKRALYFSRNPIPFIRDFEQKDWLSKQKFYKHLGLYGYRTDILKELVKLAPSELEKSESLEQLRWLENSYSIFISETKHESIGIDTPDDLKKI
ncbi:MAG: 3-deoxy-manno-octulosonate cytidylyltransferase [Flavobacteriales bacterium]|mgnify:CR=1 FL=1|nr:3-deoxy-manno-octulosonate cytidylyltransferase [Flavobacteriales bacterium]|tara:strand:+ start:1387 stop:2112 length:726 start_codon:yes stop_codon:yes gene_type:complete